MILNLRLRQQQKRTVSAEQVETLFSEGWSMREVAARMNLRYKYLAG